MTDEEIQQNIDDGTIFPYNEVCVRIAYNLEDDGAIDSFLHMLQQARERYDKVTIDSNDDGEIRVTGYDKHFRSEIVKQIEWYKLIKEDSRRHYLGNQAAFLERMQKECPELNITFDTESINDGQ